MSTARLAARLLRSGLVGVTAAGLAASSLVAAGSASAAVTEPTVPLKAGRYVVMLVEPPAATYDGGQPGLAATRPQKGEQLDAGSTSVKEYRSHLRQEQEDVADRVGAQEGYSYTAVVNGFAADLSAEQAARLAADRDVLSVVPDEARTIDTIDSPRFLGLTGRGGTWRDLGGARKAGTGTVVGIIDTGIWPENPSFAGRPVRGRGAGDVGKAYRDGDGRIAVTKADGDTFTGACQTGERWSGDLCNDKVVSARYYADGYLSEADRAAIPATEFISPRDGNGHGSHTAGTAAGRFGVDVRIDGGDYGRASGMAPAAKIAVYKVCWEAAAASCYPSDSVAAIDQAVLDGVDVLNYSISGSATAVVDPVELAFLSAAAAGVFVATSAGNSGPDAATVQHASPWVTTVAASTHRLSEGTVVLGDGRRYLGASSMRAGLPQQTPAVLASASGVATANRDSARMCFPGALDAEAVRGRVVVCERGAVARTAKSAEVARAGGAGMILLNTAPDGRDADLHSVPTVHLPDTDAADVTAYVGTAGATAALLPGDRTGEPSPALPAVAGFSSRGPSRAVGGDVLKPDISAPGRDVFAAVAPGPRGGRNFDSLSGTSMSAPHVAGLATLVLQAHPTWSPMAVKSAMMTTAYDLKAADGSASSELFDQGAGHVDPTRFLRPGLVYDSTWRDWLSFVEGTGTALGIDGIDAKDPSDLNQASISVGQLAGSQTVTRRVTATTAGVYAADADVPGMDVTVTPPVLTFTQAGQTKTFEVTLRRDDAALGEWAQGHLTWSGSGTTVRSPVAARPVAVAAPGDVTGTGTSGRLGFAVTPGTSAPVGLTVRGLVAGDVREGTVAVGEADVDNSPDSVQHRVDVPAGTTLARFDLVADDQRDDLGLFVFGPNGGLAGESATGSANEQVDLLEPPPGAYTVIVNGYATTDGQPADYRLRSFSVGDDAAGNASVTPDPIRGRQGRAAEVTLVWQGLAAGVPHLGWVGYEGAEQRTIVAIEPGDGSSAGAGGTGADDGAGAKGSTPTPSATPTSKARADLPVQRDGAGRG